MKRVLVKGLLTFTLGAVLAFSGMEMQAEAENAKQAGNITVVTEERATAQSYQIKATSGSDIATELEDALKAGYREITIPAKSYTCSGVKISGYDNVKITATGATVKGSSNMILYTTEGSKTTGITITGGTWKGNKSTPVFRFYGTTSNIKLSNMTVTDSQAAVRMADASNVELNKVTITKSSGYGLNLEGVSNVKVTNSNFKNNGKAGLRIVNSSKVTVTGGSVVSNKESGLTATDSQYVTVSGISAINKNTGYGISFINVKGTNKIANCTLTENGDSGMLFTSSSGVNVENTVSSTNGAYGMYVNGSKLKLTSCDFKSNYWSGVSVSEKSSNVTIDKGEFYGNGTRPDRFKDDDITCAGIGIYEGATVTMTDASFTNNHGCGIAVTGTSKSKISTAYIYGCTMNNNGDHGIGARPYGNITVDKSPSGKKCTLNNNKHAGILLNDNCVAEKIGNCEIKKNGKSGISIGISSKAKNINNTTIQSNKEDGIHLAQKSSAVVKKCKIQKNKKAGIGVYTTSTVTVKQSCTISGNKSYGIVLEKSTAKEISDSTISNNSQAGVNVRNSSKLNKLNNCTITNNKKYGVYCAKKSSLTMNKCTVNSNGLDGIRVTESGAKASISECTVKSNKANGVVCTNKAKLSKLQKCTIKSNKKHGLYCANKATVGTYKKNKISGNKKYEIYVINCNVKIKTKK